MSATLKILKCTACDKFCHKMSGQKKEIESKEEAKHYSDNLQRPIVVVSIIKKLSRSEALYNIKFCTYIGD